jgi:hypothetical protein
MLPALASCRTSPAPLGDNVDNRTRLTAASHARTAHELLKAPMADDAAGDVELTLSHMRTPKESDAACRHGMDLRAATMHHRDRSHTRANNCGDEPRAKLTP